MGLSRAEAIGDGPEIHIRKAQSFDVLQEHIQKRLPGAGGRLYSVSSRIFLEELYIPLGRSGLLKELFVLLPSEKPMAGADLVEIRRNLAAAGSSVADQASFLVENGSVRGKLEGIAVRLFSVTGIPPPGGREVVLLLDPAFLLMQYRNEVKTPMIELAWKLVGALRERNLRLTDAILLDLPPHDDWTLRYGFLPALLGEMIATPAAFERSLPEKWEILRQAEATAFFAQYPESMLLYRKYLDRNPGDASACYKIAMMAVRDLDVEMALQWLNRAAAADSRYVQAFVEASDSLVQKNLLDPAERILRGGAAIFPKDSRMATSLAGFFLLRGQRIRESGGDPEGAKAYFALAAQVEGADPATREKAAAMMTGDQDPLPASHP